MQIDSTKKIRILIVDDHPVVRTGLTSMLQTQATIQVVGAASTGEEALQLIEQQMPDLVLLDLRMPGMDGVETLRAIRKLPTAPLIIILTSFETDEDIYRAVHEGAHGYLLKSATQLEMVTAIQAVSRGNRHIPPRIAARLARRMSRPNLTARELEILEMMAKGLTNKQIGTVCRITGITARNHVNSIIDKLEVSDRTEAVAVAIQQGIIDVSD
jgi:two-component system, NarL family, response regulator